MPGGHNAPVPTWGPDDASLLIVGLAPGLRGANRTGRPFTGDYAGDTLYAALKRHGFASGTYDKRPDDGLTLHDCRITNAVRCVPPENKPVGEEINNCRPFLIGEVAAMPRLKVILALGTISHQSVLRSLKIPVARHGFAHNAVHAVKPGLTLVDSYHCSRYNVNTGRLTEQMFDDVIVNIRRLISGKGH
ncbi:uracil-DNA glycosylase [Lacibacterium aquatile]|uniref:Type-5 uracil-DNA glycosylase n=1 Tax=Lacibacterium aquatile TaxID=1168082 RepID=A0ABW5DU81_9PROT